MDTPIEKREAPTGKQLDIIGTVSRHILKQIDEDRAIAALQLVATLRRKRLPTLPQLRAPDPANPTKKIEEATDALIIGGRDIEIHGQRQNVTLVALFPEGHPFVEFRSYRQLTREQPHGGTLLVSRELPRETHESIFTNADKPQQRKLIELTLEAIYRPSTGESPVLKS